MYLDFRLFLGALLMALEDDAAGHGFFYFLIHSEILILEGVRRSYRELSLRSGS